MGEQPPPRAKCFDLRSTLNIGWLHELIIYCWCAMLVPLIPSLPHEIAPRSSPASTKAACAISLPLVATNTNKRCACVNESTRARKQITWGCVPGTEQLSQGAAVLSYKTVFLRKETGRAIAKKRYGCLLVCFMYVSENGQFERAPKPPQNSFWQHKKVRKTRPLVSNASAQSGRFCPLLSCDPAQQK